MPSLREAVEATLVGRDERLVRRCDVEGILTALDSYGIFDVDDLALNLETAFSALQTCLGSSAPPSFLALLKAYVRQPAEASPSTPQGVPPSTPSTCAPPSSSSVPPVKPASTTLPVIITVKFNGKTVAERSSLPLLSTTTWEEAARLRLGEQASDFASTPLTVHLFPNGQQVNRPPLVLDRPCLGLDRSCSGRSLRAPTRSNRMSKPRTKCSIYARLRSLDDQCLRCSQRECDRVGASISDAVGGSFTLGYSFAVLSFSAPVYGCARPAAKGVNMFPSMMAAARGEGGTGELCLPELYTCLMPDVRLTYEMCEAETVPLMSPASGQSAGLKGGCLAAVLSGFKRFVCHYFFSEGSASERRQPSRASRNQVTAGLGEA